jgi:ABC-type Co2+ transport system permease subunit
MEISAMNARLKLNTAHVHGSLLIAGLVGWVFGSWETFLLAALVLIITAIHGGSIRTTPSNTDKRR